MENRVVTPFLNFVFVCFLKFMFSVVYETYIRPDAVPFDACCQASHSLIFISEIKVTSRSRWAQDPQPLDELCPEAHRVQNSVQEAPVDPTEGLRLIQGSDRQGQLSLLGPGDAVP